MDGFSARSAFLWSKQLATLKRLHQTKLHQSHQIYLHPDLYTSDLVKTVIILHPCPRDTGKFAALGQNIMSPKGCLLPPEGRRARDLRPEGGNRQPEGNIMWIAGG